MVECLLSMCEVLGSNSSTDEKKKDVRGVQWGKISLLTCSGGIFSHGISQLLLGLI
jgi:hypothetical protein